MKWETQSWRSEQTDWLIRSFIHSFISWRIAIRYKRKKKRITFQYLSWMEGYYFFQIFVSRKKGRRRRRRESDQQTDVYYISIWMDISIYIIYIYMGRLPSAENPKRISLLNNLPMVIRISRINQSQCITTRRVLTKG